MSRAAQADARPAWSAKTGCLAVLALLAFTLAALLIWHWRGAVVPWDSKNQFYPMFRFLADTMAQGEWPLWNPWHFAGHPTVADPQSGLFSPTILLLAWAWPTASMQIYDAWILTHLFAGGLGVLGLFARRNWGASGAVLAAIIFMLGGSAAARLQHTGMILSYAAFPLALWALEAALARRSALAALAFALVAAFMALGRDQVAFLGCGLFLGVLAHACLTAEHPLRWLWQRLPLLLGMGIVGAAIIAVPALLTLQFLQGSNRPTIAFGVAAAGSLSPLNFITLFAPNFFGSLNADYSYFGPGYDTSLTPDWTDRAINYLYIGTLPSLLIVWHGLAGGRLWASGPRAAVALGLMALLYALGSHTPLFATIYDALPGIALYRRPADATFFLNIACALSSGYLLHRYVVNGLPSPFARLGKPAALLLIGATCTLLLTLLAGGLMFSARTGGLAQSARELALAAAVAAGGAVVLVVGARRNARVVAAGLIVALSGAEILFYNAASGLNAEPASVYSIYGTPTAAESAALATLRADIARRVEEGARPRVEILALPGPWMNASLALQLEDTLGYNPLRLMDYARAVGVGDNAGDMNLRHFPNIFRSWQGKLASLLGLEYLVIDRPLDKLPRHIPQPPHAKLIAQSEHIYVYHLGPAAPRASFATRLLLADTQTVIAGTDWPEFDRAHEALIDAASLRLLSADYGAHGQVPEPVQANSDIDISAWHSTRVVLEVNTDRPGVVVLNDLWYPGWQVSVDGARAPLLRMNVLFRGVEVGPGHHVVSFDFRPFSWENLQAAAAGVVRGRP